MGKLSNIISFVAGGAVGVTATMIFLKKKYEAITEEEIESVKKAFSKESHIVVVHSDEEAQKVAEKAKHKPDIFDYGKKLADEGYTNYGKALKEVKDTADNDYPDPYRIEPTEYGEGPEYDKQSLIFYEEDGVVADETDVIVDDPDSVIGLENLDHFDSSDVIYIRNERLEIDYEVLKDPGSFAEVANHKKYTHGSEDDDE